MGKGVNKMKVFLIHGAYGNPNENWIPWLEKNLEKLGCAVFAPEFPTPEGQTLENWMSVFEEYLNLVGSDTIVVGHSLGPAFILAVLEKIEEPIRAAFFIAPFIDSLDNPDFDKINKTFIDRKFDWDKIKKNCGKFVVFHSDNDPYVPLEKAEKIAENLGVEVIVVKKAGHFNEKSGYKKFEMLLEKIKEEIQ